MVGIESVKASYSKLQDGEEYGAVNENKMRARGNAAATDTVMPVKRERGRPKKISDIVKTDGNDIRTPKLAPKTTTNSNDQNQDDSKIGGTETHNLGVEKHETNSPTRKTDTKRGRGRPKKSDQDIIANVQVSVSTANSGTDRRPGHPRKLDENIRRDQIKVILPSQRYSMRRKSEANVPMNENATLPPITGSLRRPGYSEKTSDSDNVVDKTSESSPRSVPSIENSREEQTAEEGAECQDQKEPKVRNYDVHKASPASKTGVKRKGGPPTAAENIVDALTSTTDSMLPSSAQREIRRLGQLDGKVETPRFDSTRNTSQDHNVGAEAEEDRSSGSPTKRPKLMPSPEFPTPFTSANMRAHGGVSPAFSQHAALPEGTGTDGPYTAYKESARGEVAKDTAIPNPQDYHAKPLAAESAFETSPIITASELQEYLSQSDPSPLGHSILNTKKTELSVKSPGLSTLTKFSRVFSSQPTSTLGNGGMNNSPGNASEGAPFSTPMSSALSLYDVVAHTGP